MRHLIAVLLSAALSGSAIGADLKKAKLAFPDGKTIVVDVVDTPEQRERGLMYRKSLPKDYVMLFVFPRERGMQFWMKNTWVPLDMVFIGKDKRITSLHRGVTASTEKTTTEEVARAGWPSTRRAAYRRRQPPSSGRAGAEVRREDPGTLSRLLEQRFQSFDALLQLSQAVVGDGRSRGRCDGGGRRAAEQVLISRFLLARLTRQLSQYRLGPPG